MLQIEQMAKRPLRKVVPALHLAACLVGATANPIYAETLPKGTNLTALVVIDENNLGSTAQRVMVSTLQGIVARQSTNQIYIKGGAAGYSFWHNHLNTTYGIPYTTTTSPWALVDQFKNAVSGYVLYDQTANSNSLNAATSLCGPLNAIAVDASIESTVRSHGITNRVLDVRTRDEAWVWTNYNASFSHNLVVEQKESFSANLRDYAAMAGAFTFFDSNSPFRSYVLGQLNSDAACFGWGDSSQGEDVLIRNSSSNGVYTIGSDWALSLSTLSSVHDDSLSQHTYTRPSAASESNVHYVTFVTTDGDNVQWNIGDLAGYFNHPARGSFNMGWSISPALVDLAPSVLRWYYDNSSNGPNRDFFTVGTSGSGYFYPSMYPPVELNTHVQKLNELMERTDLDIVHINDFGSFGRLDLWNKYLAQPNIQGLFYLEYFLYNATHGALLFSTNGRPIIGARNLLWAGVEEDSTTIAHINSYLRDPSTSAGYTLVEVHVWSKNLGNVQNVVTNLAADVRVVTPDTFVKLVRNNVGRKLSYDFGSGMQDWIPLVAGGTVDRAFWTNTAGHPAGALVLDGSDFGLSNTVPNSSFVRQIILPPNAKTLSFETRADNDGLLCVQLVDATGTINTLLDWEKLPATNTWVTRTASLAGFAGQTVILYFRQNDGGQGTGETRYVDNIAVLTDGPPLFLPDAPRLLSVTATNHVTLTWRDNDINEDGFKIERRTGTNFDWTEIAAVPSSATNYVDVSVIGGTSYTYRLRSWNASGNSLYSNERTVLTPHRPTITTTCIGNGIALSWPLWAANFSLYATSNPAPGATWLFVTNTITTNGDSCQVALPSTADSRFFQLISN